MHTHEIAGPETQIIDSNNRNIAMPGQLRIQKDIAIQKHIAQFWNPQNHGEIPSTQELRDSAIQRIADTLKVNPELLDTYTWAQNNLIWELHLAGNDEAARVIGNDISATDNDATVRGLMLKTAALRIYLDRDTGWEQAHEDLDTELEPIIRDIVVTNADWPREKTVWQEKWHREMKGLARETYRPAGAFGVQTEYTRWVIK